MVRKDADRLYDQDNCILVTRVQFFAIEVCFHSSFTCLWWLVRATGVCRLDWMLRTAMPGLVVPVRALARSSLLRDILSASTDDRY